MGEPARIAVARRIDWADTDAAEICYYAVFARLVDAAESALFERLGLLEAYARLPRAALSVEFHHPLRFNERVDIEFAIARVGRSSYTGQFTIVSPAGPAVTGTLVSALVSSDGRPQPWPPAWRTLLLESGHLGREDIVSIGPDGLPIAT
jgi:acyl-CoA thioesterase FadM